MHFNPPHSSIRDDGDYDVHINPGNGRPFAIIDMGDGCSVQLTGSTEDMRRLVKASATAVAMFEAYDTPHEPEPGAGPWGVHCRRCGRLVNQHPATSVLADSVSPKAWCPAFTGPDSELDGTVYCDRLAGHAGSHHAPGTDEGSEVAWGGGPNEPGVARRTRGRCTASTGIDGTALRCGRAAGHLESHIAQGFDAGDEVAWSDTVNGTVQL